MRLIERLRWWAHECDRTNRGCQARETLLEAADEIERLQSKAEPVKRGKNLNADYPSLFECSVCHWHDGDTYTGDTSTYNYCPNCGVEMDGGENNAVG